MIPPNFPTKKVFNFFINKFSTTFYADKYLCIIEMLMFLTLWVKVG